MKPYKAPQYKYFEGTEYDVLREQAEEFFGCPFERLSSEVIRGGGGAPWLILARKADESPESGAPFRLSYEPGGVYLELYKESEGGAPLDRAEISAYIKRKDIKSLSVAETELILDKGCGRAKVAPAQPETVLNEDAEVIISPDGMSAEATLLPPDPTGNRLAAGMLRLRLATLGVKEGVIPEVIDEMLSEREYGKRYLVAQGKPPADGEDAVITIHFDTEKTGMPKVDEWDRADYRTLDLFEPVKEWQLLVSKKPATAGVSGYTVRGAALKARDGRDRQLPPSRNTYVNEEKTTIHAKLSGMVSYDGRAVTVSNVYNVRGDCDLTVGNINFDGDVIIGGNVINSLTIRASGNITVRGVVEGAELYAGGNIDIRGGVQGRDKCVISAVGIVSALYLERAKITAGIGIRAEYITHSVTESGGYIHLHGQHSSLIGGETRVAGELVVRNLGSVAHTRMIVDIGMPPVKRTRMQFLQKELIRLKAELDKAEKNESFLRGVSVELLDARKKQQLVAALTGIKKNSQLLQEYTQEYKVLEDENAASTNGRAHVWGEAHPGVQISIASATIFLREVIPFATFRFSDGQIVYGPCEKTL